MYVKGEHLMGQIISRKVITPIVLFKLTPPVILCSGWKFYDDVIRDEGYRMVSLNLPLAKALAGKSTQSIQTNITETVGSLLPKAVPVYLTDYEMLFDPRYKLDVMKLFCELFRRNELIVKWCGRVDGESLVYAEPGYADYAKYKVSDYEITCVN
jgi:hypothetical protein